MTTPPARLVALAALALAAGPGRACAPVPPRDVPVTIADESAIIVWDAATKTQHFIRRATFKTAARDFGFLVPTPSRPALAEADDAAFGLLEQLTAPPPPPAPSGGLAFGCAGAAPRPAKVRVLEETRVGGYDATVLAADDAGALGEWLAQRGYADTPALRDWLKPYTGGTWTVTAFKIAKEYANSPTAATSAVRMSFAAERPFFPYREPVSSWPPQGKRLLRIFVLADTPVTLRYRGWHSESPVWLNVLRPGVGESVARMLGLPAGTLGGQVYLTEFEDRAADRAGRGDLVFDRGEFRYPVRRSAEESPGVSGESACVACVFMPAGAGLVIVFNWFPQVLPRRRGSRDLSRSPPPFRAW